MTKDFEQIRPLLQCSKLEGMSGNGASESLIHECEESLQVRFPKSYRLFLREFGWGYFGSLELIAGLGSDIPAEWERGANVLNVATDERRGPMSLPVDILPICQNGAGDWYALDCRSHPTDESPVVFISHEHSASSGFNPIRCADSFADWIFSNLMNNQQVEGD